MYTLKYNISDFIFQYTDTQGIYFNFLNLDQPVSKAKITIHSDIAFSLDNSKIWAFGNNGSINFENGNIVLDSGGNLSSSQYMVALVKFEKNLFNTSKKYNGTFDDVYKSAFSDVDKNEYKSSKNDIATIIYVVYLGFVTMLSIAFVIMLQNKKLKTWIFGSGITSGKLDFGSEGTNLPKEDESYYWRDIPCNKDLVKAYWVCYNYDVISEKTLKKGIIGAFLLKWVRSNLISITKAKAGLFNFKDDNYAIDLSKPNNFENEIEKQLFEMLTLAAGSNMILEAKEFKKWSKKNYYKFNNWFKTILDNAQTNLEEEGLIIETTEETAGMFGSVRTITKKNVDSKLKEEAIRLRGLKKFLLDFSNISKREYIEVKIWDEYLMFAELMGIADKVAEQFSKLNPDFNQIISLNVNINTITMINFVDDMADICYSGIREGINSASSSGGGSYSGGGGDSFSGGGSSSGGSSGGGFR